MRRQTKTIVVGIASVLIVGASALPALAQADDQARLDAAIDSFEQRMTDAGWVGAPSDDADDVDDDDDDVDDDGDIAMGDDEFEQCFGELAVMFEDIDDDEFPGQTAMRESAEFTYAPDGVPATTEDFLDFGDEETVAAVAVSVEDASVELMDSFVDTIGAKETGDCIRDAMEAEMAADETSDDELSASFEIAVENESDLGVGDRSARLQFALAADIMGMPFAFDINMYMARADNDLVMVLHSTVGEASPMSAFDPVAELQTLVDSL